MPNRVNRLMLQEYTERFRGAEYLVAIGYEGLNVHDTIALRNTLAEGGLEMLFVKNRIVRRAFEELGIEGIEVVLNGQVAFIKGEDPVAIARTVRDFAKEHKEVLFRGALVEGVVLPAAEAESLADASSREDLQSQIVSAALSGGANLAAALLGPAKVIAGAIDAQGDEETRKEVDGAA